MKRIIIICEGQTEQEFCKSILHPHFIHKDIEIQTPAIKKSGGGIVAWVNLKSQIEKHLLQDETAFVSTFIDYYGIPEKYLYPNWEKAHKITNKNRRMDILEEGMKEDIKQSLQCRFIPYIQLHEFEGLLFNNIQVFEKWIPEDDFLDKQELMNILQNYQNPEEINTDNPPSHRLSKIIQGYRKILHGNTLALEIGLDNIRNKSPRFNHWIKTLENI
jgi:hypothetical protein